MARGIRGLLGDLGLTAGAESSGAKGIQVYVPLNVPDTTPERARSFAQAVAMLLEKQDPGLVVSSQRKDLRGGKVLIDWMQNASFKTTIGVYSLRAREFPTASTPVTWDEVERCRDGKDPAALRFEAGAVLERVERLGDLFKPAIELRQTLPVSH